MSRIDRIEIDSRIRQISKGDRTHLSVRAYDREGNQFSSLSGLKFDWQINSGSEKIRRIPLEEASLSLASHPHVDGENWQQSEDFLLRALDEGHTSLSVSILGNDYQAVAAANINLTIVTPFAIKPKIEEETRLMDLNEQEYLDPTIRICPSSEFYLKL